MILLLYLSYYNGNLVLIVLTRLYYVLTQNDIICVVYRRLLDNYPNNTLQFDGLQNQGTAEMFDRLSKKRINQMLPPLGQKVWHLPYAPFLPIQAPDQNR